MLPTTQMIYCNIFVTYSSSQYNLIEIYL